MYEIKRIDSLSLQDYFKSHFYYYILIFEGVAVFSVDFKTYKCNGKTILLISPNQTFNWVNSDFFLIDIVKFDGEIYNNYLSAKNICLQVGRQLYIVADQNTFSEVNCIIKIMKTYYVEEYKLCNIVSLYIRLILLLIFNDKTKTVMDSVCIDGNHIVLFQNMVENYFSQAKQVSFYATKLGMSVNDFSRKIKKSLGTSPSKIIQERVVLEAKRLLCFSDMPVKEIALKLNFEDEFYFSRYFKKQIGMSPKYFRQSHNSLCLDEI